MRQVVDARVASGRSNDEWWRRAVIYQIYPRSFQDSDNDGVGDLQGIIERLDYLNDGGPNSLGIDAIWLSPTFPSPMKDFGYDVSDYTGVHPDFGDLETMDLLIAECRERGIKLLLDFVPNHSSDQHPWFIAARGSRESEYRDWYFFRDARPDGSLPNNWQSQFGGPAWTLDEKTGQYYLHSFLPEQPDLNWRNPNVVEAMHNALRFWLKRGIDGFRIDVVGMILKDPGLADNPPNPAHDPGDPTSRPLLQVNNRNHPDVYNAVRSIRDVLEGFPGRTAVGEVYGTASEVARYYGGEALDGLNLTFNFNLIVDHDWRYATWKADYIADVVRATLKELPPGAQACFALGNHDQPRFISRHDHDGRGYERARAAALLLLALPCTPFLYYGEEIGMVNARVPEEQRKDPARLRGARGRDPERSPMQWDASAGRGFSSGQPWLPFGPEGINAQAQAGDPASMLSLYQAAIALRGAEAALHGGTYRELPSNEDVFAFERRTDGGRSVLIALSTATESRTHYIPVGYTRVLIATSEEVANGLEGQLSTAARTRDAQVEITLPGLACVWLVRD